MSWCSKSDDSDERAQALMEHIIAAYADHRTKSLQIFDRLTTEALLHMTKRQYQTVQEAIKVQENPQ